MNKIELKNNRGFQWFHSGNLYVKGYLFDRRNRFHLHQGLLEYFKDITSFVDLEEKVKHTSGSFSVIIQSEDTCMIATDIIRSFPVFYVQKGDEWIVSDNAYYLASLLEKPELNQTACYEFLATGYVSGYETLVQEIKQVQAGEIVFLSSDDYRRKFYFTFRTLGVMEYEYDEMKALTVKLLDEAFKKFITSLNGRTVLVSLSGGFDSRLIALMLKKFNYSRVICMSYGREDNPEMELAGKVAEKLGFKWLKIVYNDEITSDFMDSNFTDFYQYSANLTSMFFLQDYFAAKHLKDKSLIPDDTIIATGHAGDFLGGSQLNKHGNIFSEENIKDIANRIYYIKYAYKRPNHALKKKLILRIERSIQEKYTGDRNLAYSIHEDWDFKEKLAKFNFNSINTYTYFGYEFRFPFWDINLIEFFRDIPLEARINKYLYNDVLITNYFEPYELNFERELAVDEKMIQRMKRRNRIKYYLPEKINRFFMHREDDIYYREITGYLQQDALKEGIKMKTYGNSYNSLIIQWYINETLKWIESQKKV